MDVYYLLLLIVLFVVSVAFVTGLEKLRNPRELD